MSHAWVYPTGLLRRRSRRSRAGWQPRAWRGIGCGGIFLLRWLRPRRASDQWAAPKAAHRNGARNASRQGRRTQDRERRIAVGESGLSSACGENAKKNTGKLLHLEQCGKKPERKRKICQ